MDETMPRPVETDPRLTERWQPLSTFHIPAHQHLPLTRAVSGTGED